MHLCRPISATVQPHILTTLPASTPVFSPQTRDDLKFAFAECLKRWSLQGDCYKSPYGLIRAWDVFLVADMNKMFYGALEFQGDISNWDVSRVTDMEYIFWGAISFNGDISKWDVSRVTSMTGAFFGTTFNGDISKWDVSSVTDMSFMFYGAALFNGAVSEWDVSNDFAFWNIPFILVTLETSHSETAPLNNAAP